MGGATFAPFGAIESAGEFDPLDCGGVVPGGAGQTVAEVLHGIIEILGHGQL